MKISISTYQQIKFFKWTVSRVSLIVVFTSHYVNVHVFGKIGYKFYEPSKKGCKIFLQMNKNTFNLRNRVTWKASHCNFWRFLLRTFWPFCNLSFKLLKYFAGMAIHVWTNQQPVRNFLGNENLLFQSAKQLARFLLCKPSSLSHFR